MNKTDIAYGFAWYFIFIISATLHEAAHAWTAFKGGDPTAYEGGQVSLNPWPHIKRAPIGMVVIPIISIIVIHWPIGWASTPYDVFWAHKNPRKAAWMSAAGPGANLLLLIISCIVLETGVLTGFFTGPESVNFYTIVAPVSGGILTGLATFFSMLFTENLILFIFNIIPIPPLDGSGIISLFLTENAARKYGSVISSSAFSFIGFIFLFFAWRFFGPLFEILFLKAVNVIYWHQPYYYGSLILRYLFPG
jgi:Zn-dependent protease